MITSYECIDDNTFRYMFEGFTYNANGAQERTVACAVAFINDTTRYYKGMTRDYAGDCPEDPFVDYVDSLSKFAGDPNSGLLGTFHRSRKIDGVLPGGTSFVPCKNNSKPFTYPDSPALNAGIYTSKAPATSFANSNGSAATTGVWKRPGEIEMIGTYGFNAAWVTTEGGVIAVNVHYLTSECLDDGTSYIGTTEQRYILQDGTVFIGDACEKGTRSVENGVERLKIAVENSCEPFEAASGNVTTGADVLNSDFEILQNIGDLPTKCNMTDNKPASGAGKAGKSYEAVISAVVLPLFLFIH